MNETSTETGIVVSVNISAEKGKPKQPVSQVIVGQYGIEGDAHAGPGHRQVSLLALESIEQFSAGAERPFRYGEFAENITTRNLNVNKIAMLDTLTIGRVELEVSQLGKSCHENGCPIYQEVGRCVMPTDGIFCRVVKGGVIKPNDLISHTPRPLRLRVITMSDRASRGEYHDRSGPKVREHLDEFFKDKRWHAEIETMVLPDDASLLRKELESARETGVDGVFTTGGTGVGPKDISPDVVTAMADKLIPGIMEQIRLKFGADHPNALLSRSVAAVLGTTVVYTLPGSVRAVDEYMSEILKTMEHLLFMLHGLDYH
jgi:molybdenum cofactor synthesis domain-containing protein